MEYYYKCFSRVIKLVLETKKNRELDFWIERFCPNVEIIGNKNYYDMTIECFNSSNYDYIIKDKHISIYGKMIKYSSFLAKFITQVFQYLLINDEILFIPAACVTDEEKCMLILGDFWQGKTSTALSITKKYKLSLVSDNYVAIKNYRVIGATKYISVRQEDINDDSKSILKINNRHFFRNETKYGYKPLKINYFLLPFINGSDNNIHLISKEESKWYLYQKLIRLLSGECVLFNGNLPSPIFLNKKNSILILNIVNKLLCKLDILYISASMNNIVEYAIQQFEGDNNE